MSKYVQIDVKLLSAYGFGGLKSVLPNICYLLKNYGYDLVVEKDPSLYDMVEVLIRIKNDPHVPENAKKPILETINEIIKVCDEARELLLSRRLNELDRQLYRLEDLFANLDARLG